MDTVESLYWERYNANNTTYPDDGGALDQDDQLMNDLDTYAWLMGLAEKELDRQDAAQRLVDAQLKAMKS